MKMKVFPGDDFSIVDMDALISELLTSGLLVAYSVDGVVYWHVTGWKHQKIEKPSFKFPKFDDSLRIKNSTTIRRPFDDAPPAEGSGREGIGKEGSLRELDKSNSCANFGFEDFYSAYPKKKNRKAAAARFSTAVRSGVSSEHIISAAHRFSEAHRIAGTDKQFIPAPDVWLNKGGYDDEDLPQAPRAGPAKQKISAITEAILFMENDHGQSEINTLSDNPLIQQIPRLIGNG
jgi:hypothetical protein